MKNEDAKQRIRTIRTKIREEREPISKLNRIVTDQNLKRLLRPTSQSLDHAENFFLNEKALQEQRTPAALANWLREAEKVLSRATQQRKSFELIIRKFGAPARLISG
jgi:hypothetical protein